MMNCSWIFVLEQFMNCNDELFINFCSWTRKFNFLRTVCELFMNYFWVHNKFLNSSWTVHERLFMWTFQELLMNCSWTIFFHNKFLNSSWTVMVNCSWTLVHEPTMRVFYELFMNCSWMFMNVHEQFIKSWTTFHRGYNVNNHGAIWSILGTVWVTWI